MYVYIYIYILLVCLSCFEWFKLISIFLFFYDCLLIYKEYRCVALTAQSAVNATWRVYRSVKHRAARTSNASMAFSVVAKEPLYPPAKQC